MDGWSGQQCSIESWQSTPLPVEWGLVVLDVPDLQHAASLGVIVGVSVFSSNHHVDISKAMVIDTHNHTQTRCMLESWHIQRLRLQFQPLTLFGNECIYVLCNKFQCLHFCCFYVNVSAGNCTCNGLAVLSDSEPLFLELCKGPSLPSCSCTSGECQVCMKHDQCAGMAAVL